MKKISIVEIHLAIPKSAVSKEVIAALAEVGFRKAKWFLNVTDVRDEKMSCNADTPPTGHDIQDPGMMFTTKVRVIQEAIELVKKGMTVLKEFDVYGNFEIEGQIGEGFEAYRAIDITTELPGYKIIPDAPAYENHIVWRGKTNELPTNEQIIAFIQTQFGFSPHQIVDFARVQVAGSDDMVSRVATVYQPDAKSVFAFSQKLNPTGIVQPYAYEIGERVMLVGEKE
ncbi:MAG: hypothetical protein AAB431_03760 [Patescibacteria group bacterium]